MDIGREFDERLRRLELFQAQLPKVKERMALLLEYIEKCPVTHSGDRYSMEREYFHLKSIQDDIENQESYNNFMLAMGRLDQEFIQWKKEQLEKKQTGAGVKSGGKRRAVEEPASVSIPVRGKKKRHVHDNMSVVNVVHLFDRLNESAAKTPRAPPEAPRQGEAQGEAGGGKDQGAAAAAAAVQGAGSGSGGPGCSIAEQKAKLTATPRTPEEHRAFARIFHQIFGSLKSSLLYDFSCAGGKTGEKYDPSTGKKNVSQKPVFVKATLKHRPRAPLPSPADAPPAETEAEAEAQATPPPAAGETDTASATVSAPAAAAAGEESSADEMERDWPSANDGTRQRKRMRVKAKGKGKGKGKARGGPEQEQGQFMAPKSDTVFLTANDFLTQTESTRKKGTSATAVARDKTGELGVAVRMDKWWQSVNKNANQVSYECPGKGCGGVLERQQFSPDAVCTECGWTRSDPVSNWDGTVYESSAKHGAVYVHINHFKKHMDELCASGSGGTEDHMNRCMAAVRKWVGYYSHVPPERLYTHRFVQWVLNREFKDEQNSSYYSFVPYIMSILQNKAPPKFTEDQRLNLEHMFEMTLEPFARHCPANRSNFFSYSYVLYKCCHLLGYDEFLPHIKLLKDPLKIYEHDVLWKKVCDDLGWEFHRTSSSGGR